VTVLLDAGAFVAVERGDRGLVALATRERRAGRSCLTHAGVVGQVWRGGSRQAMLARLLAGTNVRALDEDLARRAGVLLGTSSTQDVIDAALVLLASNGDQIYTSDAGDLVPLAEAAGLAVDIVPV
jgi:hypothetical protein